MVVMKFGGTSVADAGAIRRVVEIVAREVAPRRVAVVSALAGVTDRLLQAARGAAAGARAGAERALDELRDHHLAAAEGVGGRAAVAAGIQVRILNARRPQAPGSLIRLEPAPDRAPLAAIACKRGVTVVDIASNRMLMAYGFLRRLFEVFERFETPIDVVTTSEVSVSVTVDDTSRLGAITREIAEFADVSCEPDMAIVSLVGEGLRGDPGLAGRVLAALDGLPVRLVSQAASRRSLTVVLRDTHVRDAMNRLHVRFFAEPAVAAARSMEPGA